MSTQLSYNECNKTKRHGWIADCSHCNDYNCSEVPTKECPECREKFCDKHFAEERAIYQDQEFCSWDCAKEVRKQDLIREKTFMKASTFRELKEKAELWDSLGIETWDTAAIAELKEFCRERFPKELDE
jgi:hypothetical protein